MIMIKFNMDLMTKEDDYMMLCRKKCCLLKRRKEHEGRSLEICGSDCITFDEKILMKFSELITNMDFIHKSEIIMARLHLNIAYFLCQNLISECCTRCQGLMAV